VGFGVRTAAWFRCSLSKQTASGYSWIRFICHFHYEVSSQIGSSILHKCLGYLLDRYLRLYFLVLREAVQALIAHQSLQLLKAC